MSGGHDDHDATNPGEAPPAKWLMNSAIVVIVLTVIMMILSGIGGCFNRAMKAHAASSGNVSSFTVLTSPPVQSVQSAPSSEEPKQGLDGELEPGVTKAFMGIAARLAHDTNKTTCPEVDAHPHGCDLNDKGSNWVFIAGGQGGMQLCFSPNATRDNLKSWDWLDDSGKPHSYFSEPPGPTDKVMAWRAVPKTDPKGENDDIVVASWMSKDPQCAAAA